MMSAQKGSYKKGEFRHHTQGQARSYHGDNLLLYLLREGHELHEYREVHLDQSVREWANRGGLRPYGGQEHRNADGLLCARHDGGVVALMSVFGEDSWRNLVPAVVVVLESSARSQQSRQEESRSRFEQG